MKKTGYLSFVLGLLTFSHQLMASFEAPNCPTVYQPSRCSYEEYSAEGSNACFARAQLTNILRLHDIEYDPEAIRCQRTDMAFSESSGAAVLRNPGIQLASCVYRKLDPEGPFERPGLCQTELRRLLLQVHTSPCSQGNPFLCAQWVERRSPRVERSCESDSQDIAKAIISCMNVHAVD